MDAHPSKGYRCMALLFAGALLAAPAPARAQLSSPASVLPDSLPAAERMWITSKLFASVQAYFGHWEAVPELDLETAFRDYQEEALAANRRFEFDLVTLAFMARLRNSHSGFTDRWLYEVGGGPVGITARPVDGDWVIRTSRVDALQPGDIIRTIDGMPAEAFVMDRIPYVSGSSEPAVIRRLWYQTYLFPERFDLGLADGRMVTIDRANQELAPSSRRPFEQDIGEDGIAYVYIPSFGDPAMQKRAIEFVQANSGASALIIDVRSNEGGTTPVGLIEALMDRPYRGFIESSTVTNGLFEAYAKIARDQPQGALDEYVRGYLDAFSGFGQTQIRTPAVETRPHDPIYTGPLFVLIDDGCASACEGFVLPLRTSARATVIGERTSGSTGQTYMHDFGGGMSFRVGAKRVYFPDGSQFEGIGIEPHIEIIPTADDLRSGRDPVLDEAMKLARQA
jgi:carboxyl-terminal processing protease